MTAKKVSKKKPAKKKVVKSDEPIITDIAREYFDENGVNMVKITSYNGDKVVSEVIVPSPEDKAE